MTTALVPVSERPNGARTNPPPASRATAVKGLPFSTVYGDVMQRADAMLPDQVVHVADLRMTPEGHIELPGGLRYRLNPWAIRQTSTLLGSPGAECHTGRD